jgi:hypothetical protein
MRRTQPAKIRLCCDKLSSAQEVEEVLTHELIHAYDVRLYLSLSLSPSISPLAIVGARVSHRVAALGS